MTQMTSIFSAEQIAEEMGLLDKHEKDNADRRTNPVAVVGGRLVTAESASNRPYSTEAAYLCPMCSAPMSLRISSYKVPFFMHNGNRRGCEGGSESPVHYCIKNGLRTSLGFETERKDGAWRYDAFHKPTGTVIEIVSSGARRYVRKIKALAESGIKSQWIFDSAAKGLASKFGDEQIHFDLYPRLVVSGLFKSKYHWVFNLIGEPSLFVFYMDCIWRCIGTDQWELLSEDHYFSQACSAVDGIKHQLVRLHLDNANLVTDAAKAKRVLPKTWWDKGFRYRGEFDMQWERGRGYLEERIEAFIKALKEASDLLNAEVKDEIAWNHSPSAASHSRKLADFHERKGQQSENGLAAARKTLGALKASRTITADEFNAPSLPYQFTPEEHSVLETAGEQAPAARARTGAIRSARDCLNSNVAAVLHRKTQTKIGHKSLHQVNLMLDGFRGSTEPYYYRGG